MRHTTQNHSSKLMTVIQLTTWSKMGGKFTTNTTEMMLVAFSFQEFNPRKNYILLGHFM
jgi:hypothetical protein